MALKVRKNVRFPKPSIDVMDYIKKHPVTVEDVAQNLVSKNHPNGIHANWLRILADRGMSKNDKLAIKTVVDQLTRQKRMKGHNSNA